jgi:hypothetical protein
VTTEEIDTNGGGSQSGAPGASAPVSIMAGASLDVLGPIDASGQSGGASGGAPGSQVSLSAGGALAVGGIDASGGDGANLYTGGPGGSITVTAPSGASVGSLFATGGRSGGGAAGAGSGGSIQVTSSGGSIAAGAISTAGGGTGSGPGANGGPIALSAHGNLTVGGSLDGSGSNAGGSASPPWGGGSGGSLTLHADTGTMSLDGSVSSAGGTGSGNTNSHALGGSGGTGGRIVIVAGAVGPLASLSSDGGDGGSYGNTEGPGGGAGAILAFTTAPVFNAHQSVTSDGGNGNPIGVAGVQHQDTAPSAVLVNPATGALNFTSNSPDALGYQLLMAVGTGTPTAVLATAATSGLTATAPICQQVTFTVEAVNSTFGWTSAPSPGVQYTRQPSTTQTCSQPPPLSIPAIGHLSRRRLRRDRWVVAVPVKLNGIGAVQATLTRLGVRSRHRRPASKPITVLTTPSVQVTKPGVVHLRISLPSDGRVLAGYKLDVTTSSPDGTGHVSSTIGWKIVK